MFVVAAAHDACLGGYFDGPCYKSDGKLMARRSQSPWTSLLCRSQALAPVTACVTLSLSPFAGASTLSMEDTLQCYQALCAPLL